MGKPQKNVKNEILKELNRAYQGKVKGCQIKGLRLKHGSKLFVDTYYDIQTIFDNLEYVDCMAKYIFKEIEKAISCFNNSNNVNTFLLLGYKSGSITILDAVKKKLIESYTASGKFIKVFKAIVLDKDFEDENINFQGKSMKNLEQNENVYVISIAPIGSCLTNFYKMHNFISNFFKNQTKIKKEYIKFLFNTVLIFNKEGNKTNDFWNKTNNKKGICVSLGKSEESDEERIDVNYFLEVESSWINPQILNINVLEDIGEVAPIVEVSKTTNRLDAIIPLKNLERKNFKYNKTKNKGRIKALYDNLIYTHVKRGSNHYHYYVLCENIVASNQGDLELWLKNIKISQEDKVKKVIISSEHQTNSEFLMSVIDNCFNKKVDIIYININNMYKEDVRAMYHSKVSDYDEVEVYYLDDSIITGDTASRALMFANMIFGNKMKNSHFKFSKIFLLMNRSSYETIGRFVNNPENDLYAYIHLKVPFLNTSADYCPGCKIEEIQNLLLKRSVTNSVARYFSQQVDEYKIKSFTEREEWVKKSIMKNNNVLFWLSSWILYSEDSKDYSDKSIFKNILELYANKLMRDKGRLYSNASEDFADSIRICKNKINHIRELLNSKGSLTDKDISIFDGKISESSVIQRNHKIAKKILKDIVHCLWAKEVEKCNKKIDVIPHDWRKRIIICTGNHDYASMNQYVTKLNNNRAINFSEPTTRESGTMSKFTYFIEFLVTFLKQPIEDLIKNDLNEVRNYKNMNVKILNLNSVSKVSPLRTNKIGADIDIVEKLLKRKHWDSNDEFRKVCITHYSPNYDINYIMDAYYPKWECSNCDKYNKIYQNYIEDRCNKTTTDADKQKVCYNQYLNSFSCLSDCIIKLGDLLDKIQKEYDKENKASEEYESFLKYNTECVQKFEENYQKFIENINSYKTYNKSEMHENLEEIYDKINKYKNKEQNYLEDTSLSDERLLSILSEFKGNKLNQNSDKKQYQKFISTISGLDYILCGHIHEETNDKFKQTNDKLRETIIKIGGKFFKDEKFSMRFIWGE